MIGYVPQEVVLFNDTILNNILLWRQQLMKNSRLAETIEEVIREEDGEISPEMRSVLSRYIDDDEIPEKIREEELVFDDYDHAEATREIPIAEIYPAIEGDRETSAEEREALGHCPDHS